MDSSDQMALVVVIILPLLAFLAYLAVVWGYRLILYLIHSITFTIRKAILDADNHSRSEQNLKTITKKESANANF